MLCRFTDFLVYEIGQDGETVRLRDIKGPPSAAQEKREKRKQRTATTEGQEKTGEQGDETTTQAAVRKKTLPHFPSLYRRL